MKIFDFINALKQTDKYIEIIFKNGGCYQFYLLIKKLYPESEAYINSEKDHVVIKYQGKFYDITGIIDNNNYVKMTDSDIEMSKNWSFHRNMCLKLRECPFCSEPILI